MAVVGISIIKRRRFLEIIENTSEVDNKIRYTPQEETYMNRNVMFNIIAEIILLTVVPCILIIYIIYQFRIEKYYIFNLTLINISVAFICNILILFQILNLVFMTKQRYSHLNKRHTNWINGTISRTICLNRENKRSIRSVRAVDHIIISLLRVSSFRNIEGILRPTDIHWLLKIYSELYDISCLINDTVLQFLMLCAEC